MSKSNVAMNVSSHEESEEQLNPATLDLLDHVGEILADEYVRTVKEEGKENESSDLC